MFDEKNNGIYVLNKYINKILVCIVFKNMINKVVRLLKLKLIWQYDNPYKFKGATGCPPHLLWEQFGWL